MFYHYSVHSTLSKCWGKSEFEGVIPWVESDEIYGFPCMIQAIPADNIKRVITGFRRGNFVKCAEYPGFSSRRKWL